MAYSTVTSPSSAPKPSWTWISLWAFGILTRFWDIGARTLHHDESLHAIYSFHLSEGRGYTHDPMMHGPFQFHFTALIFWLFGDSDFTARVPPAIFGSLLLFLPWWMKRWIGEKGALAATLFLTVSPTLVYFSRFLREDIYSLVFTVLAVLFAFRYHEDGETRDRDGFTVSLVLLFCTKEISFLFSALFFLWWAMQWFRDRADLRAKELGFLTAGLVAPLSGAVFLALFKIKPLDYSIAGGIKILVAAALLFGAMAFAAHRLQVRDAYLRACALFYGIFFTLYTTFYTNGIGVLSGLSGSLGYWLEQHGVQRGNQPLFYYGMLFVIYEYLPAILALVFMRAAWRGRHPLFVRFLPYWALSSFLVYSVAGEKMPWLLIHISFPFLLLSAWGIGEAIAKWKKPAPAKFASLIALSFGAFSLLSLWLGTANANPYRWFGASLAILFGAFGFRGPGKRTALLAALLILGFGFTVRHAWIASFRNSDIAQEPMIYTQSTPHVRMVARELEDLSIRRYGPELAPIAYDNEASWPFEWYLRRYKKRSFYGAAAHAGLAEFPLVLGGVEKEATLDAFLPGFRKERLKLRWWFPEHTYRRLYEEGSSGNLLTVLLRSVTELSDPVKRTDFLRWWTDRRIEEELGSTDFLLYTKRDPAASAPPEAKLVELPEKLLGFQEFAKDLGKPIALSRLPNGKILVADAGGKLFFISENGSSRDEMTGFQIPGGVSASPKSLIALIERGNASIARFTAKKEMLAPFDRSTTGFAFAGPSAIAYRKDGYLVIADRTHHQIAAFDADGTLIHIVGKAGMGPGEFGDPAALAFSDSGDLLVADPGNRVVSVWGKNFAPIRAIKVPAWASREPASHPGIAFGQGGVFISDPVTGEILLLKGLGSVIRVARGLSHPGPLLYSGGFLYVIEEDSGRVLRAPLR